MILHKNHFFMTTSEQIDEIIQPLKTHFGLTSFVYLKSFNEGSEIRLSNQPEWLAYFYEYELYKFSLFERHPSEYIKTYVVWAGLEIYKTVLEKARLFNIDHGITFIEPCADGCEFFFLGTESDRANVMPKYLANLDLLKRFLDYFREKAAALLNEAQKHKITISGKFETAPKLFCLKELNSSEFLGAPDLVEFTARELECMRLLAKGYTQKMIAQELNISVRTVETHLNHVKDKTHTRSRGELAQYLLKLPL
ncbi:MAG: hypothetical protein A3F17_08495 [Gammaproteobacteria bacterium RIFCSPHIGHO2_12_FULL_41_15]|nr:MAG: hypothetical protein A3F17_08495 [Gammaproteobacteria bacterium RIFCSPHIGHO2_12_FULL_41_15]